MQKSKFTQKVLKKKLTIKEINNAVKSESTKK